ncbi:hypothetical protein AB0K16_22245 [Nonomuraea jabiensis]|uniref:hypothetical protein n=1 Tax=Nonomuraea jabiensis TaxID=882448 RepID=UPI0034360C95
MAQITINMTQADFDLLCSNGMHWAGTDWKAQAERFENTSKGYQEPPSWSWKYAYWLEDRWADVMMARSFLEAQGATYEVLFDLAGGVELPNGHNTGAFVILTDFPSRGFEKNDTWNRDE